MFKLSQLDNDKSPTVGHVNCKCIHNHSTLLKPKVDLEKIQAFCDCDKVIIKWS